MGQPMVTEGHEHDLDVCCVKIGQPGLGADKECLRLVGDTMKNRIEFFAIGAAHRSKNEKPRSSLRKSALAREPAIRNGKPRRASKSSTNVSASTPRIAPGSTSLRSGALRAPRKRFQ